MSFCILWIILILFLILIIGGLSIYRNKKNNISKILEQFSLPPGADTDTEFTSSDLIGPNGVLQTLPHCDDLSVKDRKFPKCCPKEYQDQGKCLRAFPSSVYLKKDKNGNYVKTKYRTGKYTYNPLFPYARINLDEEEAPGVPMKVFNLVTHGIAGLLGLSNEGGNIYNWGRLESANIGTYPPGGPEAGKPITNWSNNKDILERYMKNMTIGNDISKSKRCSIQNPENCKALGQNRWEKIGKCPNDPRKDLFAYIDVTNTYNSVGKNNPLKGLFVNTGVDMFNLNPIHMGEDILKWVTNTGVCHETGWNNKEGARLPPPTHHYLTSMTDADDEILKNNEKN